jgi:hypothetical protein
MRNLFIAYFLGVAILVGALSGCGGASSAISQKSPSRPIDRVSLIKLIKEFSEQTLFVVRYNPPKCDCPPFEIQLKNEWHRVVMDDANPETPEVDNLTQLAEDDLKQDILRHYHVQGSLEDELHPCAVGHLHVMFRLNMFSKETITSEGQ